MRRLALFVASCGYIGYLPLAPGTFGSAAGLVVYALVRQAGSVQVEGLVMAVVLAAGVWSGSIAERALGRTDPPAVVLDEVLGMLVTLAFLQVNLAGALVGFLLFRLFDVVKPWPASRLEALPGGLGVMADDAMAAVYAHLVLRLLVVLAPAGWLA